MLTGSINILTSDTKHTRFHTFKLNLANIRLIIGGIATLCFLYTTFAVSTQDPVEFMVMLTNLLATLQIAFEFVIMRRDDFRETIELINKMKSSFSTVDARIVADCKRKEKVYFIQFATFLVIGKIKSYLLFICCDRDTLLFGPIS